MHGSLSAQMSATLLATSRLKSRTLTHEVGDKGQLIGSMKSVQGPARDGCDFTSPTTSAGFFYPQVFSILLS
jgi:hypothetical protein